MCGRFAIDIPIPVFQKRFHVGQMEIELSPHYNVCPGIFLPAVIGAEPKKIVFMKWGLIRAIHPRMPVILNKTDEGKWLDPASPTDVLTQPLTPYDAHAMDGHSVSPKVNNPRNDDKQLINHL